MRQTWSLQKKIGEVNYANSVEDRAILRQVAGLLGTSKEQQDVVGAFGSRLPT